MMIPITRKEKYINEIVGGGDTAPETPQTREEFFFAEILGEVIAPSPVTRVEKYLSAIAGQYSGDLPTPITRIEYFLAKAAGMDITVPVPITREEIYWSNYTAIVEFEVENVPPLTYKAIEGTLKDYRIYGNTAGGESVGDRTGNLFDSNINVISGYLSDDGILKPAKETSQITFDYIPIISGTYTFTYTVPSVYELWFGVCTYDESRTFQSRLVSEYSGAATFTIPDTTKYIRISLRGYNETPIIMLNEGSTALPYEPYGYKMPVTVSNGTDAQTIPIYLPEQIRKVGDEAEYIDYAEQKLHRVRKNLWSGVVEQGSVSTIGTYSDALDRIRSKNISLSPGTYTISCNLGIRCIFAYNNSEKVSCVVDNGGGRIYRNTFTVPSGANNVSVGLRAFDASGAEMDTVKPSDFKWGQIEKGSEATTYEPYIENTEVDVTLPALPTLPGTNVLSVGTAVQPSKVYVKYKGERQ